MLLIKLLALVTLLNTNCNTNCGITLLMLLCITSCCKPLSTTQYPLTVPKHRYIKLNIRFPLQNQTTGLANSLADPIIYKSSRPQMFFKVNVLRNFCELESLYCWSNFIQKRLQDRCFTEKSAKYSRTTFFYRAPSAR